MVRKNQNQVLSRADSQDRLPVDETSEKEKMSYPGNFIYECDGRL